MCEVFNNFGGYSKTFGSSGHQGVDIGAQLGQAVYAVEGGVLYRDFSSGASGIGWGLWSDTDTKYRYFHLDAIAEAAGRGEDAEGPAAPADERTAEGEEGDAAVDGDGPGTAGPTDRWMGSRRTGQQGWASLQNEKSSAVIQAARPPYSEPSLGRGRLHALSPWHPAHTWY